MSEAASLGQPGQPEQAAPLIELQGIRKRYGGHDGAPAVEVLRGLTLSIGAGEFVAIVGASGSGKSTLMHLLGCLDRPSDGTYRFAGQDVASLNPDELAWLRREAFGFVFQGYHLIATESARENVEVPALYAGMPAAPAMRARKRCSSAWAWASGSITGQTSYRAGSSSACRSRAP